MRETDAQDKAAGEDAAARAAARIVAIPWRISTTQEFAAIIRAAYADMNPPHRAAGEDDPAIRITEALWAAGVLRTERGIKERVAYLVGCELNAAPSEGELREELRITQRRLERWQHAAHQGCSADEDGNLLCEPASPGDFARAVHEVARLRDAAPNEGVGRGDVLERATALARAWDDSDDDIEALGRRIAEFAERDIERSVPNEGEGTGLRDDIAVVRSCCEHLSAVAQRECKLCPRIERVCAAAQRQLEREAGEQSHLGIGTISVADIAPPAGEQCDGDARGCCISCWNTYSTCTWLNTRGTQCCGKCCHPTLPVDEPACRKPQAATPITRDDVCKVATQVEQTYWDSEDHEEAIAVLVNWATSLLAAKDAEIANEREGRIHCANVAQEHWRKLIATQDQLSTAQARVEALETFVRTIACSELTHPTPDENYKGSRFYGRVYSPGCNRCCTAREALAPTGDARRGDGDG